MLLLCCAALILHAQRSRTSSKRKKLKSPILCLRGGYDNRTVLMSIAHAHPRPMFYMNSNDVVFDSVSCCCTSGAHSRLLSSTVRRCSSIPLVVRVCIRSTLASLTPCREPSPESRTCTRWLVTCVAGCVCTCSRDGSQKRCIGALAFIAGPKWVASCIQRVSHPSKCLGGCSWTLPQN